VIVIHAPHKEEVANLAEMGVKLRDPGKFVSSSSNSHLLHL